MPPARSSLIVPTLKTAVGVAAIAIVAAHWLASGSLEQSGLRQRIAAMAHLDPITTGSIQPIKLDPCTGRARP